MTDLVYSIHGLRIRSEIPLPELVCDDEGAADVEVTLAEASTIPAEAPEGRVLAARDPDLGARYPDYAFQLAHDRQGALQLRDVRDIERETHESQLILGLRPDRGHVDLFARERITDIAQ